MVNWFLGTNMTKEKNISISSKLIVYFLFSAIFISSIGIGISFYQDYIFLKSGIKKSFDRIESFVVPEIKKELKKNNVSDIKLILDTLFSSKNYSYISLSIKLKDQTSPQKIFKKGSKKGNNQYKTFSFNLNNFKSQEAIGNLVVYSDNQSFVHEVKRRVFLFLSIQSFQFIFFSLLILFILKKFILNHIKEMAKYAEESDLSNESNQQLVLKRSKSKNYDEIDQLVKSLNKMKSNLYENHERLKDYTNNLETKVQIRTEDLSEALKNMESLLNNLKQAIFTVNEEGVIESPSSSFSKEIFDKNIEGLSIFETIFSSLSENSETYSAIQFANACNFGNDEFQWNMILDQYPSRVVLSKNNNNEEKILKIDYIPLWNRAGLLKKIMYVVEDVTEVEKLEFEMKAQKQSTNRKVKILQEIGIKQKARLKFIFS